MWQGLKSAAFQKFFQVFCNICFFIQYINLYPLNDRMNTKQEMVKVVEVMRV